MKKCEIKKLIDEKIAPNLPDLVKSENILYAIPLNSILRGIAINTFIRNKDTLEFSIFACPLYMPHGKGTYIGAFSKPVRRSIFSLRSRWNIRELESITVVSKLVAELGRNIKHLPSVSDPLMFAQNAVRIFGRGNRDRTDFAIGLSYARAGNFLKASRLMKQVLERDPFRFVPEEIISPAMQMEEAIQSGRSDVVQKILEKWEVNTIKHLTNFGLELN